MNFSKFGYLKSRCYGIKLLPDKSTAFMSRQSALVKELGRMEGKNRLERIEGSRKLDKKT